MGERVFPYLKLDKCWKPRIVAALRAQEPDDHDPGKEKRYKTALENLRKQHLWGDVSDEKYQIEKAGLERQLKLAAPPSRPPQLPNLERAAELLEELPPLWLHEGVTNEQREALLQEVFHRITIDGKEFASIEPNPAYVPPFATMLTDQQMGYRAVESTPSPNTQILLASGITLFGVEDWVTKLANVA